MHDFRRWKIALCATMLGGVACVPPAPPEPLPPPAPPRPIYEEELKPVEQLKLEIIDLNETAGTVPKTVTVTGTIVNRGQRASHTVSVHVEALDKDGAIVVSADPTPSTQTIVPGSTARFAVTFETRDSIDRYHVEAIGR